MNGLMLNKAGENTKSLIRNLDMIITHLNWKLSNEREICGNDEI
jgi:hypothetical protein